MLIQIIKYRAIAFVGAMILDALLGDPHSMPHPIRLIGALIACLDRALLPNGSEGEGAALRERLLGTLLWIFVIMTTFTLTMVIIIVFYRFGIWWGVVCEAMLMYYTFAARNLADESLKVYDRLLAKDLPGARKAVSMIVGRDTDNLDEGGVARAAVETVAENTTDGVIAPMIFAALGGPVASMVYKAVNTMDSMIGYRNDRYRYFGSFAARADDVANFLPARISALLMLTAAAVAGPEYDAGRAFKIFLRDRGKHKSPNAAQTESVAAGALGVALAGDASYFGRIVHKPVIGEPVREIEAGDIPRTVKLMVISTILMGVICLLCMGMIVR